MMEFLYHLGYAAVAIGAGVYFATPITDWLKGVPAHARTELSKLEDEAIAKAKAAL